MRNLIKWLGKGAVVFCCLFTIIFGGFLLINTGDIAKMATIIGLIDRTYLGESSTDKLFEGATAGLVSSLGDKYSTYYTVNETKELFADVQGVFGGIGITVPNDAEKTVIADTIEGSAAEKAGLRQNDVIIAVDGEDVTGLSSDQVVSKIRGDIGTSVKISIMRESDNRIHDFNLVRELINKTTATAQLLEGHEDIAYLRISEFSQNTDEAVVETLNELIKNQGFKGLIIDLRNNGGGNVDSAVNIARMFVPEGPVVHIVDKNGINDTKTAQGAQITVPLVVLVNQYSASASEILAGAIKDTHAGTLVGATTYGKGLVQTIYPLADGSSVKLTTAKYLTPNKNDIHAIGIVPDVEIDFPEEMTIETFHDVQLDKAIEIMEGMI